MTRTGAYDIPRATNWNTSSFSIYVPQGPQFISYDANIQRFRLQNNKAGAWLFYLEFTGRSLLPATLNEPEYTLYSTDAMTGLVAFPTAVMFLPTTPYSSTTGVSFNMVNTTMTEILAQDSTDPTLLLLQDRNIPGLQPFSFRFQRENGFGGANLATPVDAQLSMITPQAPEPSSDVESYLHAIGSSEDPAQLTVVALGCSIVGRDQMTAFLAALPSSITVITDLSTWITDVSETAIDFASSPYGVDVRRASISAVVPKALQNLDIGGLQLSISAAVVLFDNIGCTPKTMILLTVTISSMQLELKVFQDHEGPITLEFRSSGMSPLDILRLLNISSGSSLDIPLGGGTIDLGALEQVVGFTMTQPCTGTTNVLHLDTIYFTLSANWDSWKQVLPDSLQPVSQFNSSQSI
jgi:hypothetical protein